MRCLLSVEDSLFCSLFDLFICLRSQNWINVGVKSVREKWQIYKIVKSANLKPDDNTQTNNEISVFFSSKITDE